MAKKILIVILLSSTVFLAGCHFTSNSSPLLDNIKEEIDKSADMECRYTDEKGNLLTAYVKNKDEIIKVSGVEALGQISNVLIKDNQLWWWQDEKKSGIVFDLSTSESYSYKKIFFNPQEFIERINLQRQNCSPTLVSNSQFDPPPEINFVNFYLYFENPENTY